MIYVGQGVSGRILLGGNRVKFCFFFVSIFPNFSGKYEIFGFIAVWFFWGVWMKKVISCVFSVNCSVFLCYVTANTEANFSTFLPNMVWRTCKWYNASFSKQVKQHKSPRAVRRFLLCHCHSLSIIQIPRFIGTPNTDQQMNSSYFMPSLILPLQIAIKDTPRF